MSDVMLFGVLKMPYEMAMSSELSRLQFYQRVLQLVARVEAQPTQPERQPLTLNEISAMEEKVYMRTTHKGKPLFEYAQALIRATEAAHGIKENA